MILPVINVGAQVEEWTYTPPTEPLNEQQRALVIEFAAGFEECHWPREVLATMEDISLISAAYMAMADYARGQM